MGVRLESGESCHKSVILIAEQTRKAARASQSKGKEVKQSKAKAKKNLKKGLLRIQKIAPHQTNFIHRPFPYPAGRRLFPLREKSLDREQSHRDVRLSSLLIL
jgi:hypothetical protein